MKHFMFYLDLNELNQLQESSRLFAKADSGSALVARPYLFNANDHLPGLYLGLPLIERVKMFIQERQNADAIKRISLLTSVRTFGYVFNPVSFFYCFDALDKPLYCLAEIGNTFGEKKLFLLVNDGQGFFRGRRAKGFYISPFTSLEQELSFDLQTPDEHVNIAIDTMHGAEPIVRSQMRGRRLLFTDMNLLRLTLRFPLASLRVISAIHWQAVLLWLKGTPFKNKEENLDQQTAVLNPHISLRQPRQRLEQ
jgi:DUF1365 family protein